MLQDATPAPNADRPRQRVALDSSVDRSAAFRQAGRHTAVVRSLRLMLPISAIAMLASYGIFMQRSISVSWGDKKVEVDGISISSQALVAHNPRYTGFNKQGGEFEVKASTAEQDLKQKGLVRLKEITGRLTDSNRSTTDIKAVRGTLETTDNVLEMYERIDVASQNGMTAELTRATVYTKENRIVSNEPVTVRMPTGVVRGNAMTIEQKARKVLFTGGVVANLQPQPKRPVDQAAGAALRGTSSAAGIGQSDKPVEITSSRLLIDDNAKLATFAGNVVAKQVDSVLETTELEVSYEGQPAGDAKGTPATAGDPQSSKVRRLVAKSDVVLTRGIERATGSSAEFDAINDLTVLMGPVVVSAGPERGATADRADMDNKNETILLQGNVVLTQQKNVLKGRRLVFDRKKGTMQLTAPAQAGQAKGQISARLQQAEPPAGAAKKGGPPAPAKAPAKTPLAGGARPDSDQPIDIDADTLDVDDRVKTAVFRGKVRAVQGDYQITTEELVATYSGEAGLALGAPGTAAAPPPAKADQAKAGQDKAAAQLQKVSAPRLVEIVAKDGQRARGNSAVFDTKANTALLTGDVRLVQGSTITTGPCALLDMNSGSMRVIDACGFSSTPASASAAPAGPTSGGRAQVLIYPGQLKDEKKDKDKDKAGATGPAARPQAPAPASAAATAIGQPSAPATPVQKRVSPRFDDPSGPFGN